MVTGHLEAPTGDYTFVGADTRLGFSARHLGLTTLHGRFERFHGHAHIDFSDMSRSTLSVRVDASSVHTGDAHRDAHLRGRQALDVAHHPHITFESARVDEVDELTHRVTGPLRIRAVSCSVSINLHFDGAVREPSGNVRVGFTGEAAIRRRDWGLVPNAPLEGGDLLVSDTVLLHLQISAALDEAGTDSALF